MKASARSRWPVLRTYDQNHLARVAMPIGGIGTGSVSLGGRGDLRDWEIMNRPGKKFVPGSWLGGPSVILWAKPAGGKSVTRLLEGPLDLSEYEGGSGCPTKNHGLPRFENCAFAAAYPLGQVTLADRDVPLKVRLEAFNPLIPADADASGIPVAVLRYVLVNPGRKAVAASVCATVPNFIGEDGSGKAHGSKKNRNRFVKDARLQGIFMDTQGVDRKAETWGTLALTTTARAGVTYSLGADSAHWGSGLKGFWKDFADDGKLDARKPAPADVPPASLAVRVSVPAGGRKEVTFLLTWHFPNRYTWTPDPEPMVIGNYYTTKYRNALDVARKVAGKLPELEARTVEFVRAFCDSDLPAAVKEAALFNVSTLRVQTTFRTPDGCMFGWEGYGDHDGCCHGSCTHVWNYEQATAFLFGDLAKTMREVEFAYATAENGAMSFRVGLPLDRARKFAKCAADGQMGCIMKMYRDWQLSGDDRMLKTLWPNVKKALAFCWIAGGWDGDRDGVMEGCQHNTMDVEYYGPNPQMEGWYLGALRAGEEMARYLKDDAFADACRDRFERGRKWTDKHLFNGEYYEHEIRVPAQASDVPEWLRLGAFPANRAKPGYQLGSGCLVDQLVGQFMAHVCGLGHLLDPANVRKTLQSIRKYNHRKRMHGHFNCLRSFALGEESALLMASYPKGEIEIPFPYYTEVMTGFEYAAAINMIQEGQVTEGLRCIADIRDRYDGLKRSPFDEAECGHHYARAMASWAAVPALTEFAYSGVDKCMALAGTPGKFFWSNGHAYGTVTVRKAGKGMSVELAVLGGGLTLKCFELRRRGCKQWGSPLKIAAGGRAKFSV